MWAAKSCVTSGKEEAFMSRIGKLPIALPKGITAACEGRHITVKGPKGQLERDLYPGMVVEITPESIKVLAPESHDRIFRGMFGLTRTLIANMVQGVSQGFEKHLEIQGIGYRAAVQNNQLTMFLGFSHQVDYKPPKGITLETPKPTQIVVKGIDKETVGAVAAELRFVRKPEPYKGKGVRYEGEYVRIKVGKSGAGAGAGAGAGGKK
jgi:large subunit ribosomal protein L6